MPHPEDSAKAPTGNTPPPVLHCPGEPLQRGDGPVGIPQVLVYAIALSDHRRSRADRLTLVLAQDTARHRMDCRRISVIWIFALPCLRIIFPGPAFAIAPPDFVANAGLQAVQLLGLAVFFCSTGLSFIYQKYRALIDAPSYRAIALVLIGGGFALAWYLAFNL